MSPRIITLLTGASVAALRPAIQTQLPRAFAFSTSAMLGLKESAGHNPDNANYEHHKQDSLNKQKKGEGHWKPELASDSEEAVKADRSITPPTEKSIKEMQERTKASAEETHQAGTSMRDGL